MPRFRSLSLVCLIGLAPGLATCDATLSPGGAAAAPPVKVLRLAVTTSTYDSGLLDVLLPVFEHANGLRVDVLPVGTGKALALGRAGDVDALIVHDRPSEDAFLREGFGTRREEIMKNFFQIVGPAKDPAHVKGLGASAALGKIASSRARFVSRGDQSGTHKREARLWAASPTGRPAWPEYLEAGQGMGRTLVMADEMRAYTLTDRSTFVSMREKLDLVPLVGREPALENRYAVIAVNPARFSAGSIHSGLADRLIRYLLLPTTQTAIGAYRKQGEALFVPLRLPPSVARG